MLRRMALGLLAILFVPSFATAKDANGTVKSVTTTAFVVTDSAGKDWTFDVDKDTLVVAKGGSHKLAALKADGKPSTIDEYLAAKQSVGVAYTEKDGKMVAKEVRIKDVTVK